MEYPILLIVYWFIPIIVSRYVLPKERLLMMSPIQSVIVPYIVIGSMIYIITTLFSIIQTYINCPTKNNQQKPYGIISGLKLGVLASLGGLLIYYLVRIIPMLMLPFLAISILPYSTIIGEGFYVAMGSFLGYWLGRIFIATC